MGVDRISSYNNIKDYPGSIDQGGFKQAGKLPHERDVLMAMERGDLNEALRLVQMQAELTKNTFFLLKFSRALQGKLPLLLKGTLDPVVQLLIKMIGLLSLKPLMKGLDLKLLKATLTNLQKLLAKLQSATVQLIENAGTMLKQKLAAHLVKPIVKALEKASQAVAQTFT